MHGIEPSPARGVGRAESAQETNPNTTQRLYHFLGVSQNTLHMNPKMDKSWLRQARLGRGLWISMAELSSKKTARFSYHKRSAKIDFGFLLSGHLHHRMGNKSMTRRIRAGGNFAGIGYFPNWKGVVEIPRGRMRSLHVHIAPGRLLQMVKADLDAIPPAFRSIIRGGSETHFFLKSRINPLARAIAHEILNTRFSGPLKKVYLECKALELITVQLQDLLAADNCLKSGSNLSSNEKNRIREAHDWLVADLSAQPTLNDLSQRFSLSHNKLQNGFRALFGDSVFRYLREHKLQTARILLVTTDMNVSQVAWEIDYTNVSQFAKAFKKRFGLLPKQYSTQ